MVKEKEQFDAENFLESFREEAVPTYRTAKKDKKRDLLPTASHTGTEERHGNTSKMEIAKEVSDLDLSAAEAEFLKRFVADSDFTSVTKRGRQISVSNEHRRKIQKMLILFSEDMTIAGYIYNVLEEHFKAFDDVIQSLYKKVVNTKL